MSPHTSSLVIQGGRLVDPSTGKNKICDIFIEAGLIQELRDPAPPQAPGPGIDATGKLVVPGLIDMHVHLREPGQSHKETIRTGTAAAVAGGFTAVACMPNTDPPLDDPLILRQLVEQCRRDAYCRVYPIAALTARRAGKALVDFASLASAGAVGFSDDGVGLADTQLMAQAFKALSRLDKLAIQHCEDPAFPKGVLNEGPVSQALDLPGIPPEAEESMIARDLQLAARADARYHVAHISTLKSLDLVRVAKRRGTRVTTEVCPHHLLLTEEACLGLDPNTKVHPPLRGRTDVAACLHGVVDGTIDVLVTDHAPHSVAEKRRSFADAPPGIVGLETSLALFVEALVTPGHLDWLRLIHLMSTSPARILGIPGGSVEVGQPADLTIIDPTMAWTINAERFFSKGRNCPFQGRQVTGLVVCTIVGGEVKFQDGRLLE